MPGYIVNFALRAEGSQRRTHQDTKSEIKFKGKTNLINVPYINKYTQLKLLKRLCSQNDNPRGHFSTNLHIPAYRTLKSYPKDYKPV